MRILVAVCLLLSLALATHAADLRLIPMPQKLQLVPGEFSWSEAAGVVLTAPARADDRFAAQQLAEELQTTMRVALTPGTPRRPVYLGQVGDAPMGRLLQGESLGDLRERGPEAYFLLVRPERIIVAGVGPAGTFYGVQTLKQLIRANRKGQTIPCVRVLDWPGLRWRGYSDDISRGPIPTMDFFKRQIRTMAEHKMNMLTFYTEHVFKLKKHPIIAPPDGITAEEVKELSAYARRYHVELVGNFQSFGHFYNILRHEEYAHLRETMSVVTPAKEETYQFLDDVYSEIATAYESPLFNVNCDETYGLGEGPSKELAAQIGVGGVYLRHMNRIHDLLRDKYGKRMMMWGDIALQHPDIVPQLAQDTILLSWGYGAAPNYDAAIQPFVRAGLEFMVCPGVSCWSQIFPQYENAMINIQNYVRDGARFGALGMLNTTWDDDGENLFSWNFYGTNWGAACAWRPLDSDRERYDDAFAATNYGTLDTRITRAIKLLAGCANNPLTQRNFDPAFWVRPTTVLATTYEGVMKQANALCDTTAEAIQLIEAARPHVKLNAQDLDYLLFAARRLHFIGRMRQIHFASARQYSEALLRFPETQPAAEALAAATRGADEMVTTVEGLLAEYRRLWLLENRPWWLKEMAGKYEALLKDLRAYHQGIVDAQAELAGTGVPPDPATVGLQLVETGKRSLQAVPAAEPLLPPDTAWWDARWPHRLPLRVQAADNPLMDYPVSVAVNFGEQAVDPASVRVVEHTGGTAMPLLTQYEPGEGNTGRIVFILPGATAPQATRSLAVYFDAPGSPAKPPQPDSDLKVWAEGGAFWVENDRLRVLIGRQGAHVYEWFVKALGDLEITEPGRWSYFGFADSGFEDRDADFALTLEAAGPVQVRIRGVSNTGSNEKVLLIQAGKPYVEVMLARPVGFYWDYDNVSNFAADNGNPGTALFSDGKREPVCRSDEQVHSVASDVYWGAKVRADGLVLANITPSQKTVHMTGPGGGWGGVGIESSPATSHFVTFADQVTGDPMPVLNVIQQTLDLRVQPRLWVGKVETRP